METKSGGQKVTVTFHMPHNSLLLAYLSLSQQFSIEIYWFLKNNPALSKWRGLEELFTPGNRN